MIIKPKTFSSCENKSWDTLNLVILYLPNKPILALYKAISIDIGAHWPHHRGRYRLTSWTLVPTENRGSERSRFWDTWGSGLSIIALQEAKSGLKQWALYHYIASLGDGTADTDGWLTITVHDGGFKHTAQKAEHISKGSVLALYSGGWSLKRLFLYDSAALPWFLVSWTSCQCLYHHLPHQVKERGTIRFIPELVHNLASALALRAPLASIWR